MSVLAIAIILFLFATVFLFAGIAGLTGKLRRNRFFGVRSPETLRDDEAFRVANRVAGPTTTAAGAILALGGVAALAVNGWFALIPAVVSLIAAVFFAGFGASLGIRAAEASPAEAAGPCSTCSGCSIAEACAPEGQ
ncbi:hypothetical protein GCM10011410_15530 [Hoyosella rhizosphaerae]|uniref:SdpI family protein n=1 Tax=Hoyosella rhizosphaerae TaxID=1755582 RepID=A0A916U9W3_9ACTN|nr:hypothetical protein GCM10011410_15530 [Hoyosella rhizosphaerae]